MNLSALIQRFRREADDKVKPYLWSDPDVTDYLNDAEAEAARRANLIRDSREIDVSAGDTTVEIGAAIYDIQYAELTFADGTFARLRPTDRETLTANNPRWRSETKKPESFIHDEKSLAFDGILSEDATLYLEFYRTPEVPMASESSSPEIAEQHHDRLVDGALAMAFSRPDADGFDPNRAKEADARFTAYFGKPKTADLRRRQNKNTPHRNRVHL